MTLDDAIRRERHAMRQSFGERSNEHRQLAEWLKELKQWKELAEGIDLRPASLMVPFQPNVNDLERENDRLKAENAKLRELLGGVGHLLFALDVDYCAACPRDSNAHPCPVYTIKGGECLYKSDMRELGIEVDNG